MSVTIRQLLSFGGERLRVIVPASQDDIDEAAELSWIHGSDLLDPTPFLEQGHLLLTDGSQFAVENEDQSVYDAYVARLVNTGIAGVGFGSQLFHMGIPAGLVQACQAQNLVLIELTDMTPYFDYVKFVANASAQDTTADTLWSLKAQRAITRAALKPGGLGAVLSELGRRIGCEVVLYDSSGKRIGVSTDESRLSETDLEINEYVTAALRQGTRATRIIQLEGQQYTIQTIGNHSRLDGAISFGQVSLDQPLLNDLIANVVAIASLVLTQNRMLTETRRELRSVALNELLAGRREFALRTVEVLRGSLPEEPFSVLITSASDDAPFVSELLERELDELDGSLFYGSREPYLVLLVETRHADSLRELLTRQEAIVGVASRVQYADFQTGYDQAERAYRRAIELNMSSCDFDELANSGIFSLLASAEAQSIAQERVQQLIRAYPRDTQRLLDSARVWLQLDCSWEQASHELGIHRHTLRNRIESIARTLSLDLQSIEGRMELWATLRLTNALGTSD